MRGLGKVNSMPLNTGDGEMVVMSNGHGSAIRDRESTNRGQERAHEVLLEAKRANSGFGIFVEAAKEHEEALLIAITAEFV